jgi:hypothetical protein
MLENRNDGMQRTDKEISEIFKNGSSDRIVVALREIATGTPAWTNRLTALIEPLPEERRKFVMCHVRVGPRDPDGSSRVTFGPPPS